MLIIFRCKQYVSNGDSQELITSGIVVSLYLRVCTWLSGKKKSKNYSRKRKLTLKWHCSQGIKIVGEKTTQEISSLILERKLNHAIEFRLRNIGF